MLAITLQFQGMQLVKKMENGLMKQILGLETDPKEAFQFQSAFPVWNQEGLSETLLL